MRCPKCQLENPDSALICDCGYSFEAGSDSKHDRLSIPATGQQSSGHEDDSGSVVGGIGSGMMKFFGRELEEEERRKGVSSVAKLATVMFCALIVFPISLFLVYLVVGLDGTYWKQLLTLFLPIVVYKLLIHHVDAFIARR